MSQRFCTNCGAAMVDGAAFCVSCGTPAQAAPAPPPAMPPAPPYAPAAAYPAPPAAPPPHAGQGGYPPPPAYPGTAPRASGWTWQRWALLAVGAVLLLGGLKQMGVLDRMANANSAVVGRWASDNRCMGATTLNANGSFIAPNGAAGRWTLSGDRLTLSGASGSTSLRVISTTRNSLTIQGQDGPPETLVRC